MIDSKGRLFGKISIVDIIFVAAVIIAVCGVYVRFYGGPTKTVVQNSKYYYTLQVSNIRGTNKDALNKSIGSRFMLNEKITSEMGKLISVDVGPAKTTIDTADGEIVMAEVPDKYNVTLTFEIEGKVNERGFFTPSLEDISAGVSYNVKSKYTAVTGTVMKVWQ